MPRRGPGAARFWVILILALAIGELTNTILRTLAPAGPLKEVVLKPLVFGLVHPVSLDLLVFELTFGFVIRLSLFSILMILFALYFLNKLL